MTPWQQRRIPLGAKPVCAPTLTHIGKWISIHFMCKQGQSRHPLRYQFRRQPSPEIHYGRGFGSAHLNAPFERCGSCGTRKCRFAL